MQKEALRESTTFLKQIHVSNYPAQQDMDVEGN
jgi:hypothetical protein